MIDVLKQKTLIIILVLALLSVIPSNTLSYNNINTNTCLFILAPGTWYLRLANETVLQDINVLLRYSFNSIELNATVNETIGGLIRGFFENHTIIVYSGQESSFHGRYNYTGNVTGLISSLIEDSKVLFVKGVYSENISLKSGESLRYNLLNSRVDFWTATRQRVFLVDFRIRASSNPQIALGVSVNASSGNITYNVTYYADSVHRELFIPVNPLTILLNNMSSLNSLNVTLRAFYDFKGVVDVVLYVLELPQPVINVKINGVKTVCKPFVFLDKFTALTAITTIVRRYYSKITSPPPSTFGTVRVGDELLFDYVYKVRARITNLNQLNKSRLSFLVNVFRELFSSTNITFKWLTSIQFKVNAIASGIINYVFRILHLEAKYSPTPVKGISKPICGDGLLGLCPILWLNKLRGVDSTISRALSMLPSSSISAVNNVEWLYLPWATDIAFPGYQATPENIVVRPSLIARVYLGYPFASLTSNPGATWFTSIGIVRKSSYGTYYGVPIVGLEFHGKDYKGYIYVDTFYLTPIKSFFNGSPNSWQRLGIEYNVYYNLSLFRWKGFWRNIVATAIPLRIESKNSNVELLLIASQPGGEMVKARIVNDTILLEIEPDKPIRILLLGKGKPYDSAGAYWIALPLISDLDIVYPTTLVYIDQENPSTYNFIAAFPVITVNSSNIRLLVLNGDKWMIKNISVGEPFLINNREINIQTSTSAKPANETTSTTTSSREEQPSINIVDRNIRLLGGLALFIAAVTIILVYKKLRVKQH